MGALTPDKLVQFTASRLTDEALLEMYGQAVRRARKCAGDELEYVLSHVGIYAAEIAERIVIEEVDIGQGQAPVCPI